MSVSTPVAPVSAPAKGESYRPLSALALIGVSLGFVSQLIYFFDSAWYLLFFPLPALVCSALARRQIRRSEGTLAGEIPAIAGIVLSVTSGLGWTTNYVMTYWVITQEAGNYADAWFEKLQQGKEGEAFLDIAPPQARGVESSIVADPHEMRRYFGHEKSGFEAFRKNMLVDLLTRYREQLEWKRLGVGEFAGQGGNYAVSVRYHIRCPAFHGEVVLFLSSDKAAWAAGASRAWKIELEADATQQSFRSLQPTPYADEWREATQLGRRALTEWLAALAGRMHVAAVPYLLTPLDQKRAAVQAVLSSSPMGQPAVATGDFITRFTAPTALQPALERDGLLPNLVEFEKLYWALRGRPTLPPVVWRLVGEQKQGPRWNLKWQVVMDNGKSEVEFLVTTTGTLGNDYWYVSECKLVKEMTKK